MVVHHFDSSTQEVEAGNTEFKTSLFLESKFQESQGYRNSVLKNTNQTKIVDVIEVMTLDKECILNCNRIIKSLILG